MRVRSRIAFMDFPPDRPTAGFDADGLFRVHGSQGKNAENSRNAYDTAAVDRLISEYFSHLGDEGWITKARAEGMFDQYFAVMKDPETVEGVVFSLQRLIWLCDDRKDEENARKYRRILAECFLDELISTKAGVVKEFYRMIKVDTLRRAGLFSKARSYLNSLLFENSYFSDLAALEKTWIKKRDSQCCTDATVALTLGHPYKPADTVEEKKYPAFDAVKELISNGISCDADRYLMGNSLFYYCSGKDPTPILAFGADFPLYIYVDIADSFNDDLMELYDRLRSFGYKLGYGESIKVGDRWHNNKNMVLSSWGAPDGRGFRLANICGYAEDAFRRLYSDRNNFVQPRCICNYRYEFIDSKSRFSREFFEGIEKRTEFIFGHCFNDKYNMLSEFAYHGDYGVPAETVKLYRRSYWYLN